MSKPEIEIYPETANKITIKWIVNALGLGKRGTKTVSIGFCQKTKKVAFFAIHSKNKNTMDDIKPLIIHDVYVNAECEDAKWCVNLECPLNKATPKTLQRYVGKHCTAQDFQKFCNRLQEVGKKYIGDVDWSKEKQNETQVYPRSPYWIPRPKREKQP